MFKNTQEHVRFHVLKMPSPFSNCLKSFKITDWSDTQLNRKVNVLPGQIFDDLGHAYTFLKCF